MKAPMAIVVLAVAGGAVAVCRGQVDWRQPFPNVTSALDTNPGIIFRGRVELEMRRTGGPRPSVVMGILEDAPLPDGRTWTREALAACDQGLVRCSDVLKVFDRLQAKGGRTAPVFGPRDRGLIEEAAEREALSQEKRDDLHRRALARGGATEGTVSESQGGAAFRIYAERILELYPVADALLDSDQTAGLVRARAARRVALASASSQPVSSLMALVREVAEWDAHAWSLPDDQRRAAQFSGASPRAQLLDCALRELRRLNLPGTLGGSSRS